MDCERSCVHTIMTTLTVIPLILIAPRTALVHRPPVCRFHRLSPDARRPPLPLCRSLPNATYANRKQSHFTMILYIIWHIKNRIFRRIIVITGNRNERRSDGIISGRRRRRTMRLNDEQRLGGEEQKWEKKTITGSANFCLIEREKCLR